MTDEYYLRQIHMPEIGTAGQARIHAGRVLVVGAGGLGSAVLFSLAGAGVGRIGIVDPDRVTASNLNRQFLYTPKDIGFYKAETARRRISAYHPDLTVEALIERVDHARALSLFLDYDLIVGAVDSVHARRIINAACCRMGKPWIDGGIMGFSGYTALIHPGRTPCYDCLFGYAGIPLPNALESDDDTGLSGEVVPRTAQQGVIGTTAGIIGSLQANLAILELLGLSDALAGGLLSFSGRQMTLSRIDIKRTPDCPVCGHLFDPEDP